MSQPRTYRRQTRRLFALTVSALPMAVVLTVTMWSTLPTNHVLAQSPYPPLRGFVANGTEIAVSEARINNEFQERLTDAYALDGIVLLVEDCSPDPEVYLDEALVHYGLADAPGAMYDDAVAIFVCQEPSFVGSFWGADNLYADRFDDDAIADAMIPDLQAGNFTGAVTSGMDTLVASIEGRVESESNARSTSGSTESSPWRGWLLGGGMAAAAYFLWRRRGKDDKKADGQRNGAAPDAAPLELQPVKDLDVALADLRTHLTPTSGALARLVHLYEALGDDAMLALDERHKAMLRRRKSLEEQAAGLVRGAQADPETGDPEVRRRYAAALEEANALRAYINGLRHEADHAEELVESAAILAVDARKAIDTGRAAYAADRARDGRDTLPDEVTAMRIPTLLADRAESALSADQRLRAGELAEDAKLAAEHIGGFLAKTHTIEARIDEAAAAFERIDDHAESSWADIRGNGSEAEESVIAALDLFNRVLLADPEDFGDDLGDGFAASIDRAETELGRARTLADAVVERLAHIEQARAESAGLAEQIADELAEARAHLARPEIDREVGPGPEIALEQAAAQLAEARAAMTEPRPDWMAVRRSLLAADRAVDDALGGARAEQERVAALRRQLATARKEAEAAMGRLEQYLRVHRADLGAEAGSAMPDVRDGARRAADAEQQLESLSDDALSEGLRSAAGAWTAVRDRADGAYELASRDVARADERRKQYVPRPTWIGPTVPIPSRRRGWPMPRIGGGWGDIGGGWSGSPGPIVRPPRRSSWGGSSGGGRSRGGATRIKPGRGSSGRRGGGKGW